MKELNTILEQLAAKIGTTVEYLWAVLIKQAHVNATINLSFAILALALIITALCFIPTIKRLPHPDTWNTTEREIGWSIFAGVIVFFTIVFIACFIPGINQLLNPEYWALNQILEKM